MENLMKKSSRLPKSPKIIHVKELLTKKIHAARKIPHPLHTVSNSMSLISLKYSLFFKKWPGELGVHSLIFTHLNIMI